MLDAIKSHTLDISLILMRNYGTFPSVGVFSFFSLLILLHGRFKLKGPCGDIREQRA